MKKVSFRIIGFLTVILSALVFVGFISTTSEEYIPSEKNIHAIEKSTLTPNSSPIISPTLIVTMAPSNTPTLTPSNTPTPIPTNTPTPIPTPEVSVVTYTSLKYPVATEVWNFFKTKGYNDYVIAGILGNMMAEAGGQTLDIQWNIWNSSGCYYGICQWHKGYDKAFSKITNTDLDTQINFLNNTIKHEFDTYGRLYKSNFNYESFLALEDEQAAALSFAKCYERCGSGSYSIRQKNATKALNYFSNL